MLFFVRYRCRRGGEAGTNYRGPAVRKGVRGQTMLRIKAFYSPTNAQVIIFKNNIQIYITIAPRCFGAVTPSSCRSHFNVNFNIFLRQSLVHSLVNKKL